MGGTALLAALCLSACPVSEPSVSYIDPDALSAAHSGVGLQLGSAGQASVAVDAGMAEEASYTLSFDVTTAAQGGRYQPKNIGAIWIETPAGQVAKTLELWAKTRRRYLTNFNSAVGTTGSVDVTASATLPNHVAHHVSWDHRDRSGAALEAGPYRLCVEATDTNASGKFYCLDFDTSTGAQSLTPSDQPYFKSLSLRVQ